MLRAVRNSFISPLIKGFKATSLSGACTLDAGSGDVASAASVSAGKSYLTMGETFGRVPVVVASPVKAADNLSGAALIDADPTITLLSLKNHDGTNPLDGGLHAFAVGWESANTDYYGWGSQSAPFSVKSTWGAPRLELFKVTPHATTPVINIGNAKATLTRNGAGDYTITLKRTFASDKVVAVALPIGTTIATHHIVSATAIAIRVLIGVAGTGSDDFPFYLLVEGSDSPTVGSRHRKVIRATDRAPRLIAGHVQYSAGTPSINIGTGDFAITDTGTGILTVTPTVAFAREPIVIATQNKAGNVTLNAAAGATAVINCFNAAGVATDPDDLHFIIAGFDDANEYTV